MWPFINNLNAPHVSACTYVPAFINCKCPHTISFGPNNLSLIVRLFHSTRRSAQIINKGEEIWMQTLKHESLKEPALNCSISALICLPHGCNNSAQPCFTLPLSTTGNHTTHFAIWNTSSQSDNLISQKYMKWLQPLNTALCGATGPDTMSMENLVGSFVVPGIIGSLSTSYYLPQVTQQRMFRPLFVSIWKQLSTLHPCRGSFCHAGGLTNGCSLLFFPSTHCAKGSNQWEGSKMSSKSLTSNPYQPLSSPLILILCTGS